MNVVQKIIITAVMAGLPEVSALARDMFMTELLQKPLITGASVSADWGTASPGMTLALRYTVKLNIKQ